jgi:hypothetical protein
MVEGNSLNHLGDFKKRIKIMAYFLEVNEGLVCGMGEGGREREFIRDFWVIENSHLECG